MLLSVTDLKKSYPGENGPVAVLDGVSLTLKPGETVALTGESGSGKSTLLHIVGGLEAADAGEVTIDGTAIAALDDRGRAALRRRDIGVVFQQFNLIPSLTVAANITFQARLAGVEYGNLRLENLVETLGLQDHLGKYPEQLSGGQQQRVAIARAILPGPKLLLADEPTGNLDETTADAVIDALLAQVRMAETAMLLVTHSDRLAARADRRLHLQHGRVTA
jgi:putative ABC transport system ATP-binding protein